MTAEVLAALIRLNVAISALIIPILILRNPVRRFTGPDMACRMWLILLLAACAVITPPWTADYIQPFLQGLAAHVAQAVAALWLGGVAVSLGLLIGAHLHTVRKAELGEVGPAVIGLFHPRVYLPAGFEEDYSEGERFVMRAHERAHLLRGDATANALMALIQCLFWFNPLVHMAAARLRRDQEMATDATVMEIHPERRRLYAETMLKTQLSRMDLPMGCAFIGGHPLEERIAALALRAPSSFRQVVGGLVLFMMGAMVIEAAICSYTGSQPAWTPAALSGWPA